MTDFHEARSPLTKENVHNWGRNLFPLPLRALPKAAPSKWIQFDASSFNFSRSVWRSLDRSVHKQLLIIGGYAPGPIVDDEPTDRVVAHVHSDEAEVSFYRITKAANGGDELVSVTSTSSVAFHAPFCDVGEDTGGSKAIHRVSALILYYFLAAGHVKELQRTRSDPTMFTRNFKDACSWVENGGQRPIAAPSRRSSTILTPDTMVARPTRASTISSRSSTEASWAPPPVIRRSKTDDFEFKRKRHDKEVDNGTMARPRKHPRRTLSEQIQIPRSLRSDTLSPKSPAPERVHQALSDRIQHLKDENAGLKDDNAALQFRMEQEAQGHKFALEQLLRLEAQMDNLMKRVDRAEGDVAAAKVDATTAKKDAASAKAELTDIRKDLAKRLKRGVRK